MRRAVPGYAPPISTPLPVPTTPTVPGRRTGIDRAPAVIARSIIVVSFAMVIVDIVTASTAAFGVHEGAERERWQK